MEASTDPTPVVMSVLGPVPPEKLTSGPIGPTLCQEWLLNDQKSLQEEPSAELLFGADASRGPKDMASASLARRWPLASLYNLHISVEDAHEEIVGPLKRRCLGSHCLLFVTTPRGFWSPSSTTDYALKLRELARKVGSEQFTLVSGTSPRKEKLKSAGDVPAEVAYLVAELTAGFEGTGSEGGDRVLPGFIGEIPLSDDVDSDRLLLLAAAEVQRASGGAALLLSGAVSEQHLAALREGGAELSRCAFCRVPSSSPISLVELSKLGAFVALSAPPFAGSASWQAVPLRAGLPDSESTFISSLFTDTRDRMLLGSGLRFKSDLTSCGGGGLAALPDLLAAAASGRALAGGPAPSSPLSLPSRAELRQVSVAFFSYAWKPPPPPEKVERSIACHWCGVRKPEGEHFSKHTFDYCSPKCLGKHRAAGFEPDRHDRG